MLNLSLNMIITSNVIHLHMGRENNCWSGLNCGWPIRSNADLHLSS